MRARERIGIYGDYDVDGQTSTALMVRVLGALGADVVTHIPHRTKEGYGLNIPALEEMREKGCSLVITVDCGISAVEEADWARQNGLDLIITDHHKPHDELPHAGFDHQPPAGSRVSLPAPCRLRRRVQARGSAGGGGDGRAEPGSPSGSNSSPSGPWPTSCLSWERIRALVRVGLAQLNAGGVVPGLEALRAVAGVHTEVTAGHVGFVLAPRLNAVGRVGDPAIGLKLLLAPTYDEALPLARRLEEENGERRRLEDEVAEEARRMASELFDPAHDHGLVVHGEGWHPGVIGIVASRLAESYYRPTVVLSIDGDEARGSARSIPGFDLYQALSSCSELFTAFGGHQAAAGLTLPADRIDAFRDRFAEVTRSLLSPEDLIPRLNYDCEVDIEEIDIEWVEAIRELEPFGMGNPTPVVVARNCVVQASAIGNEKAHLKLRVADRKSGRKLDGIGFGIAKELLPRLGPEAMVDIAFVPEVNEWKGRRCPQLRLKDVRPASAQVSPAARLLSALEEAAAAAERLPFDWDERDGRGAQVVPPLDEVAASLRATRSHRQTRHPAGPHLR